MQKLRANVIWNHPLDRQGTFAEFRPLRILPDNLHRHASDWGIDLPNMTQFQSSKETKHPIKRLTLKRPSNSGFGVLNSWRSRTWRWFVCFFCGWKLRGWKRGCFTGWPCYSGQRNDIWRTNARTSCQGNENFNFTANYKSFCLAWCLMSFVKFLCSCSFLFSCFTTLWSMIKILYPTNYGQFARKSSRPKSCRPKPESCRLKFSSSPPSSQRFLLEVRDIFCAGYFEVFWRWRVELGRCTQRTLDGAAESVGRKVDELYHQRVGWGSCAIPRYHYWYGQAVRRRARNWVKNICFEPLVVYIVYQLMKHGGGRLQL